MITGHFWLFIGSPLLPLNGKRERREEEHEEEKDRLYRQIGKLQVELD